MNSCNHSLLFPPQGPHMGISYLGYPHKINYFVKDVTEAQKVKNFQKQRHQVSDSIRPRLKALDLGLGLPNDILVLRLKLQR